MSNMPITPYRRSPLPVLPESVSAATSNELQKLSKTLQDLVEAVQDLQKRVTALNG